MNKNTGYLGSIIIVIAIVAVLNFINHHQEAILIVSVALIFLSIFLYRYWVEKRKKTINEKFNEIVVQNEQYFEKFKLIAHRKSVSYDEYGDQQFNEDLFSKELNILVDKLYPIGREHALEIRQRLIQYAIDFYNNSKGSFDSASTENLTGIDFEIKLAQLFEQAGYIVTLTKKTGDQGADLIMKMNEKKIAVQAKYYTGAVGNKAVQEVIAAVGFYNANEGWVVTNSDFTKSAKELAIRHNITLINGNELKVRFRFDISKMITKEVNSYQNQDTLDSSIQISLENILIGLKKIKTDSIVNRQHSIHKVKDESVLDEEYPEFKFIGINDLVRDESVLDEKYTTVILYDISQVSNMLNIDSEKMSKESQVLMMTFGFFLLDEEVYNVALKDLGEMNKFWKNYFPNLSDYHTSESDKTIKGLDYFIDYRKEYLLLIKEYATLLADIKTNYNINSKDQEVLDFYREFLFTHLE